MVARLYRDDPYLKACEAVVVSAQDGAIELDRTVFYAMGGGQPGDSGTLSLDDGRRLRVADTRQGTAPEQVMHLVEPGQELPATGARVRAEIDWARRHRHMRLHTALHLLCAVVHAPVTGGRIDADKAHLDFDIEMERLVKAELETGLNALVQASHHTRSLWVDDEELDARPELVKTMSVAPPRGQGRVRLLEIPGIDLQACGGTHVADTREIGALIVTRIRSEGRRNRRVTLAFAE